MTDTEEPPKVCRGRLGYLHRWQVSHIPDALRHFRDIGRLVSPPPVGLRSQVGRIGFHEQLVQRNLSCDIPQILRLRIRHIPREGDQETYLHPAPRFLKRSCEAMEDSAQAGAPPVFFQDLQAIRPRFAAMNDHRSLRRARLTKLMAKDVRLYFARRMIVMIVESDFSPRNHARVP